MSKNFRVARSRSWRVLLISGLACIVIPSVASASAVNLATASPFVVLGGSTVTNTGPSVLNGELGVAPGTSLVGFGLPAVVNGAIHDNDSVAAQAEQNLTTAYTTAAGQPVSPGNVLTGQDLGGKTLTAGAYKFATSAQLTGALTLNAQGNPNAQFVFEIGSTLTTASASSVILTNGASPCNVYWQIGSSATLGSATAFEGNLLASTSITLNSGATVQGRALASTGAVSLDDNVLNNAGCATSSITPTSSTATSTPTSTSSSTSTPSGTPSSTTTGSKAPGASTGSKGSTGPAGSAGSTGSTGSNASPGSNSSKSASRRGSAKLKTTSPSAGAPCNEGFTATVTGREIKRVVFTANGKWLSSRIGSPFRVHVGPNFQRAGVLKARVTFKDSTNARTLSFRYRACAMVAAHPLAGPSTFTG